MSRATSLAEPRGYHSLWEVRNQQPVFLSPFDEQLSGKRLKLYPKTGTDSESELAVLCTYTHQQDRSWVRHTWHTAVLQSHAGSVWFCNRPASVPTAFLEHHCLPRGSASSSAWSLGRLTWVCPLSPHKTRAALLVSAHSDVCSKGQNGHCPQFSAT